MDTRNDNKGRADCLADSQCFFASGHSGNEQRADGVGGFMPRGYYCRSDCYGMVPGAPYSTRQKAMRAMFWHIDAIS